MLDANITDEDRERVKLLQMVSKDGLKQFSMKDLQRLQELVEKKDYSHNKKAHKSKMKLLAKINVRIYELEEGREGI